MTYFIFVFFYFPSAITHTHTPTHIHPFCVCLYLIIWVSSKAPVCSWHLRLQVWGHRRCPMSSPWVRDGFVQFPVSGLRRRPHSSLGLYLPESHSPGSVCTTPFLVLFQSRPTPALVSKQQTDLWCPPSLAVILPALPVGGVLLPGQGPSCLVFHLSLLSFCSCETKSGCESTVQSWPRWCLFFTGHKMMHLNI